LWRERAPVLVSGQRTEQPPPPPPRFEAPNRAAIAASRSLAVSPGREPAVGPLARSLRSRRHAIPFSFSVFRFL